MMLGEKESGRWVVEVEVEVGVKRKKRRDGEREDIYRSAFERG